MKHKQNIFLLIITLLFVATLAYGMNRYKGEDLGMHDNSARPMDTGWFYEDADGLEQSVRLPARLEVPANTEYSINTYIPDDFPEGMSILFRTSQQSVRVQVDGETIYERGQNPELYPGNFRGSSWNTVLLLQEYRGKELTITLLSPYEDFSGRIGEVFCGYESELLHYVVKEQIVHLICAVLLLLFGIMLFIFHVVKARSGTSSVHITYLALFAVFCSFYVLGESRMLQFFTSNQFLITTLPFLSEIISPIPLLMYVKGRWMPQHRWIAVLFTWAFAIDFLLVVMLQLLGIADVYETLFIFHGTLWVGMIVVMIVSAFEIFKYKNQDTYSLICALFILMVGSGAGMLEVYLGSFYNVSLCMQVGVLGFELVMAIDAIRFFYTYEEQLREKNYYEKLAYRDALTDGKNRNAYMERVFELSRMEKCGNKLCFALFDMNNLKKINDKLGHVVGDDAIQRAYRCLMNAFGKKGDCYRIGGDEFAIIMDNCDETDYEAGMEILKQELEENNREIEYSLSLAGGYAVCGEDEEVNFESLMRRADKLLYENKREIKAELGDMPLA